MSSVGSISTPSNSLLLQMLQGQNNQGTVGSPQNGSQGFDQRIDAAASSAGLNSSQVTQMHTDIQTAIQTALQNAPANGDKRTAVQNAVNGVLQKYGIDPSSVKPQTSNGAGKAHHHRHGGGKAGAANQASGAANDTTAAAATNPTDAALDILKGLPTGSLLDTAG